jgi:hypothetical protein
LWKKIEDVLPIDNLASTNSSTLRKIQPWLLGDTSAIAPTTGTQKVLGSCLDQVAFACGDAFRDIVQQCLTMDAVERPEYSGEKKIAIALRLQRVTEQDIVKRLDSISRVI